jgi:hypothetical protein
MSVASEINRIKSNIADAYTEAEAKGATMPVTENSDNLADTIASISGGGGIPIDEDSLTPLVFGIDSDGFYFSDTPADETPVSFGRDSGGIYVAGGATA